MSNCLQWLKSARPDVAGTFDIGQNARRVARNQAAKPPATRKIADKRKRPAKHKKPLRGDE